MNWIILFVAGLFESGFAFCLGKMKEVSGTAWWLWGAGFLLCLIASMTLLAKAVQTIPIGTAYPIWTGIGAVCTVILGIRRSVYGDSRHHILARACDISASVLHHYPHPLHYRTKDGLSLRNTLSDSGPDAAQTLSRYSEI